MENFSTRPELKGTFGMTTSTHWLASSVGMSILERGGNSFDAAVAMGFMLQVVEPHLNGPGGEVPILFQSSNESRPKMLCGQGISPARANIEHFHDLGLDLIPGTGHLAAVVPGAFSAWMTLLRDYGTMTLKDVLSPAIFYAKSGYPLLKSVQEAISSVSETFEKQWPSSAEIYLRGGTIPRVGRLFTNPNIARTWEKILTTIDTARDREKQIKLAEELFYRGFIAEEIIKFFKKPIMDSSGFKNLGIMELDDMANWSASYEDPISYTWKDYEIFKGGPWSQGPVLLQQLALLKYFDLESMDPNGTDFIHTIVEVSKLAFADREAFYGDPNFVDTPVNTLLSEDYNKKRFELVSESASKELIPGDIAGYNNRIFDSSSLSFSSTEGLIGGIGEPTMADLSQNSKTLVEGDTCHINVIDKWGNMVAATPSGGWFQSSPVIPNLGFSITTRAQMFWLNAGLPGSLQPKKRPRTTLSPCLAYKNNTPYLVWGTPGGDAQDQWNLIQFIRHTEHGLNLQETCDAPMFHSAHFPSSFYPRQALPARVLIENRFRPSVSKALKRRGHDIREDGAWAIGRNSAISREENILSAGASPRRMQGYAVGR